MSEYKSPTETLKRIKNRLESGYFMLNDDIKWLLSEYEKQQKEIEKLEEQMVFDAFNIPKELRSKSKFTGEEIKNFREAWNLL